MSVRICFLKYFLTDMFWGVASVMMGRSAEYLDSFSGREDCMTGKPSATVVSQTGMPEVPSVDAEKRSLLETIQTVCDMLRDTHEFAAWFESPDTEFFLKLALDSANKALKAFQSDFLKAVRREQPTASVRQLPPVKRRRSSKAYNTKSGRAGGGSHE
jgi:hypothetical protein